MRHFKQLIYGIMYLAFWVLIIAGVYNLFIKPAPSCFNNRQDPGEEAIDCGGICSRICLPPTLAPVTGTVTVVPLGEASSSLISRVSLLAEIRNPNTDFTAKGFSYEITVRSGDKVIATIPGASFIYPSQIKYLVLPNQSIPGIEAVPTADITITNPQWVKKERFPAPQLSRNISGSSIENGNFVIRGTLANQDAVTFDQVELDAVFYDSTDTVVGLSETVLENIAPQTTREFTIFHPVIPGAALEKTQVIPSAYNPR